MSTRDLDPEFRETIMNMVVAKESEWRLREVLAARLAEGVSRERLIEELMDIYLTFRAQGNEEAEDLVADVSDFLTGWCAPQHRL